MLLIYRVVSFTIVLFLFLSSCSNSLCHVKFHPYSTIHKKTRNTHNLCSCHWYVIIVCFPFRPRDNRQVCLIMSILSALRCRWFPTWLFCNDSFNLLSFVPDLFVFPMFHVWYLLSNCFVLFYNLPIVMCFKTALFTSQVGCIIVVASAVRRDNFLHWNLYFVFCVFIIEFWNRFCFVLIWFDIFYYLLSSFSVVQLLYFNRFHNLWDCSYHALLIVHFRLCHCSLLFC